MAKVINIWWLLLLIGLLPTMLTAQSVNSRALQYYNKASSNLKSRPPLAAHQAIKAADFAAQARNTSLEAGSYLLAGKAFIAQNDFANASLYLKRGIQKGKSIKSAPLVVEGSTLLSSISVRQNQYKLAYEQVLQGINFYNSYPNTSAPSTPSNGASNALKQQVQQLKNLEKTLTDQLAAVNLELEESKANYDSLSYVTRNLQIALDEAPDSAEVIRPPVTEPIGTSSQQYFWGLALNKWLKILSLLSLGLLGALIWLATRRRDNNTDSVDQNSAAAQLSAEHQATQAKWEDELQKKERLIADYEEEITALKEKNSLGARLFKKDSKQAVRNLKGHVMFVEIAAKGQDKLDPSKIIQLERSIPMILKQNPKVHFVNKVGSKLLFVGDPLGAQKGPQALINFGEELQEYFQEQTPPSWIVKIAVHSGPLIFTKSDDLAQGVDVWGEELDCCNWLLGHTQAGHLTITSDARDQLAQPEGWTYLGEQLNFMGKPMRIFKKT